ncbi:hypothetical protein J2Z79_003078 [Symbiobacterium terraclitae]|uniref:Uncharacterized protein n=1 Tax=Symbiobacterium terraclitae TaxID=557451 RepID=A0ABS4JXL2_9FIRM|nr:hypothetical protein [Symbiobacterium terraclitae]MBP2019636.1 hypothetical protein [Symbiobacterium terraclitae]
MPYFERLTPNRWPADAHIQTPCDPLQAAAEFSRAHPDFTGMLEVSVQGVVAGRPVLSAVLVRVKGPGRCCLASEGTDLALSARRM